MLKYVGNGDWMPGIPKRDLTAKEVRHYGRELLLSTGLYAPVGDDYKKKPGPSENKIEYHEAENKAEEISEEGE